MVAVEAQLAQTLCWSESTTTCDTPEVAKLQQHNTNFRLTIKLNLEPSAGAYADCAGFCFNTQHAEKGKSSLLHVLVLHLFFKSYERNTQLQTAAPLSEVLIETSLPWQ